jgi:hypothetical protein
MANAQDNDFTGSIEIRPEVTMLSVLRHLNYKPWFAIAEFIDNALQSYLVNQDALKNIHGSDFRLEIDVRIDTSGPGQIVITDNAAGISTHDMARAFRTAEVPPNRSGLSEFGMGMKSAACWFSKRWDVRTKAIGEIFEHTVRFDVQHIVDNKIESIHVDARDVGDPSAHYTVVTLRNLHHLPQGRTVGKIKDHLASIYRIFIRDGRLNLRFNNEPLSYVSPKILVAVEYSSPGVPVQDESPKLVEWRKNIELDFGAGQRIRGFAALREVGSTPLAGFALFRRDRLVIGSHDETYRPSFIFKQTNSYPYQRLFGELHVEGFEVSHTKDGFRWEQYEDIFLEHLKEQLECCPLNLLAQAENYRALPSKKGIEVRASAATTSVANYIENQVAPLIVEAKANPVEVSPLPHALSVGELQVAERTVCINDGNWDWVIVIRASLDPSTEDWVALAKQDPLPSDLVDTRRLIVELALAHPFSVEFLGPNNENVELFLRIATVVCISVVLAEDLTGEPPESVLYHFNYLMRGALLHAALRKQ